MELKQEGAEYVLRWDDKEIIEFLQDTDMIDTINDFLGDQPATDKNGSKQIKQISTSC
jgi:hypothetical protein